MSKQTFKTKLGNSRYILFDYGTVTTLPQIDPDLAAICTYNNDLLINQKGSTKWEKLAKDGEGQFVLQDVVYGTDDPETPSYSWNENLLTITHNLSNMFCNVTVYTRLLASSEYSKTIIPHESIDENSLVLDCYGLDGCVFLIMIK